MASISRASSKSLEEAEIFQVLEGKMKFDNKPSTRGTSFTTTYRKFLGKMT